MSELKIENTRQLLKRTSSSGVTPTTTTATTIDSSWLATDIMVGEMYANVEDDLLWFRTNNGIIPIATGTSGGTSTASNGLTEAAGDISLGGTLDSTTLISGDTYEMSIVDVDGFTIQSNSGITLNGDVTISSGMGLQFGTGDTEVRETVTIGDWNMDSSASVNVAHNLSSTEWKTIRSVSVIVRNDADSSYYDLNAFDSSGSGVEMGGIANFDVQNFYLYRSDGAIGGIFDSGSFSATSYNRGWVSFWYQPD